jgi:PTS system mannose-specific IIA component
LVRTGIAGAGAVTPVILLGHGTLPDGLRDPVELILGPSPRLRSFGLAPDVTPEDLRRQVRTVIEDGALILVDVLGGTPSNVASEIAARDRRVHVVAGVNLPMVLEVLTSPPCAAAELATVAIRAGAAGVLDVSAIAPRLEP